MQMTNTGYSAVLTRDMHSASRVVAVSRAPLLPEVFPELWEAPILASQSSFHVSESILNVDIWPMVGYKWRNWFVWIPHVIKLVLTVMHWGCSQHVTEHTLAAFDTEKLFSSLNSLCSFLLLFSRTYFRKDEKDQGRKIILNPLNHLKNLILNFRAYQLLLWVVWAQSFLDFVYLPFKILIKVLLHHY